MDRHNFQKMMKLLICCSVILVITMTISCGDGKRNTPEMVVDSFAVAYFNWRFKDAEPYVTYQSRKWLRFAASQVDSEDVDSLRAMEFAAAAEVDDIVEIDDSTALANVTIKNFIVMDSIGMHPRKETERKFEIPVAMEGNYWKVKLTHLP